MRHVRQIKEIIESGKLEEAHSALDDLLSIGPKNTEAIKLKASLFASEGRFQDESKAWERVLSIDNEDQDAITYFLNRQVEDKEHFYFTDDLPEGGRRFLAYPRALVSSSAMGLMGCLAFLVVSNLSVRIPALSQPSIMLGSFGVLVLLPWVRIILTYLRALKAVTITKSGIEVSTRFQTYKFVWNEVDQVCLARNNQIEAPKIINFGERKGLLTLIVVPKNQEQSPLEINLDEDSSAIRARSYFIREITKAFQEPKYVDRESLAKRLERAVTF